MKTGNILRLLAYLALSGMIFSTNAVAPKHGWLKTEGGDILNDKGKIVQLRGMSFYWSNPSWQGIKYYNAGTVNTMVNDWKCTVLRVAYDPTTDGWTQSKTVIDAAIAAGIYVIIDWHSHDAQNSKDKAVAWFKTQAQNYKTTPNVIFEPFNEPIVAGTAKADDGSQENALLTWAGIKPYLTEVTQTIRDQGADNLVILGTPWYSQFVNVAAADQPKDKNGNPFKNVAYSFHFYAGSHGPNAMYKDPKLSGMEPSYLQGGLMKNIPIFITEWGTTHRDGGSSANPAVDTANTEWWFNNWVDKYHLGHCNWSISDLEGSSCFSSGTTLSKSGVVAQKHIKTSLPDEFVPASEAGSEGPASDSIFSMPGYHPAKGFNRYNGGNLSTSDFSVPYSDRDNVDVQNAANTCVKIQGTANNDWISYYIKPSSALKQLSVRWLAKDGTGNIDILLNHVKTETLALQKNSAWVTSTINMDIPATTSADTLTFQITSAGGSGFLIEWFRLTENIMGTISHPARHSLSPVIIAPLRSGFDVTLPEPRAFETFRIIGPDGTTIKSGAIGKEKSFIRFSSLPSGMWFLELKGIVGRQLLPAIVR